MNITFKPLFSVALLTSLVLVQPANAIPVAPGTSTFIAGEPDPIGGVVVCSHVDVFVAGPSPGAFSGTITSTAILGDASNPFAIATPGALTFTYLFSNDAGSAEAIKRFTAENFAGFLVDVSFQIPVPGGSVAPVTVDRSASGDVIGFDWFVLPLGSGWVAPGTSSALLVVQTDATTFTLDQGNLIDGAVTDVTICAPSASIPDGGATVLLLGCVLVGIEGLRRRLAVVR